MKRLPDYLILVLKRFEFDLDTMMKVKINDRCEFPFDLDMLPYCQQSSAVHPQAYYEYTLRGTVVH